MGKASSFFFVILWNDKHCIALPIKRWTQQFASDSVGHHSKQHTTEFRYKLREYLYIFCEKNFSHRKCLASIWLKAIISLALSQQNKWQHDQKRRVEPTE